MLVEQELCKTIVEYLQSIFTTRGIEVEVDGNWLVDEDGFKDVDETGAGSKVYVTVSPRTYETYTAKVAEFDVKIEADFRHDDSFDGAKVAVCYGRIIEMLDLWHDQIDAVKQALSIPEAFDPVGLRLSGGAWERTNDPRGWSFDQSFAVKGRIHQLTTDN